MFAYRRLSAVQLVDGKRTMSDARIDSSAPDSIETNRVSANLGVGRSASTQQQAPASGALSCIASACLDLKTSRETTWSDLTPQSFYARHGQRALHLGLVACALPLILSVALPIALINLAIFGDPRKILFLQPRVGRHGEVFIMVKFRTMIELDGSSYKSWSSGGDGARVTRFGRLLRNSHLDELPQMLNILRGDMNLVGPRPEMLEINAWASQRVPGFGRRLALLPGITGRSQITQGYTGKNAEAYAQKLHGDEHYRCRLSLAEDLAILARTCLWMLRGRGWQWSQPDVREDEESERRAA
ncbi:MAG TPA: sugar transferase [Planctomycetes bacterium]|nr:sugar transferase [Planctomycetota bacterium]HIL50980.1 sugar transferase [Planctomycetota bacterium]